MCWDALDGSTLYQLIGSLSLDAPLSLSIRALMAFWYASVGVRIAVMFACHLDPSESTYTFQPHSMTELTVGSPLYRLLLDPPGSLSDNPTVDRSLSALRLR